MTAMGSTIWVHNTMFPPLSSKVATLANSGVGHFFPGCVCIRSLLCLRHGCKGNSQPSVGLYTSRDMFYRAREIYTYTFLIIFSLKILGVKLEVGHQENASANQIGMSCFSSVLSEIPGRIWYNNMCNLNSGMGLLYHTLLMGFSQV